MTPSREVAKMFDRMSKATANEMGRLFGDVPVALLTLGLIVIDSCERIVRSKDTKN